VSTALVPAIRARLAARCGVIGRTCLRRGVPPAWLGYRWLPHETLAQYIARRPDVPAQILHAADAARNPLPRNVASRDELPADRGWWGYSFRDVPERRSGETIVATIPDCRVVWYRDAAWGGDFHPAIVTGDGRALDMREVRFRPRHAETLRHAGSPVRIPRATWILERVYHNHSHWLTAHLPKLLLLRERRTLDDVLLPASRPGRMDDSLRLAGFDPERFPTFDPERPLAVDALTVIDTDRFRPELLRLVRNAMAASGATAPSGAIAPSRRIFISRSKAGRRRLVNEDHLWPVLAAAGFERVHMEDLTFAGQVALMRDTAVLLAPHGAGLTNMLFCPPGTDVVELADLGFPNPNFYAIASAMGHRYWLLAAEALGDGHPLEKDLRADIRGVEALLAQLPASPTTVPVDAP
jgi:capsular polysaccharide biosynthesis protein